MKVGFTGTQQGMTQKQIHVVRCQFIKFEKSKPEYIEVHHGDCIGADKQFHVISEHFNTVSIGHLPEDESKRAFCEFDVERDPKPYLVRNHDIVDESDYMIAAPGESKEQLRSGTWATIRYTKKKKKPLIIIYPDGSTHKENWK